MALVIWNARYLTPAARQREENQRSDMQYGATREGVQKLDETLRPMSDREGLDYIARRRGAEDFPELEEAEREAQGDGLFNAFGKADLQAEKQRMDEHPDSTEWRFVLSFEKQELQQSGYSSPQALQQLLAAHMPGIAQLHNISPENMVWNAAFHPVDKHGRDHHPHVHIYLYSTDPREGVQSKQETLRALEKGRSVYTNAVFAPLLSDIQRLGREARLQLRQAAETMGADPDWAARCGLTEELDKLRSLLPEKGKLVYGYLPAAAKKQADRIVRRLTDQPVMREAYGRLEAAQRQYVEAYNDEPEKIEARMESWRKRFFHPTGANDKATLHNAVIRLAMVQADDGNTVFSNGGDAPTELEEYPEPPETDEWVDDRDHPPARQQMDALIDKAKDGDVGAMFRLACMVRREHPEQAKGLFQTAWKKGIVGAAVQLGHMALTDRDTPLAIRFFEEAALAGDAGAMYQLGKLYERGRGMAEANPELAEMWYRKAADAGVAWASVRLAAIYGSEKPELAKEYRERAVLELRKSLRDADESGEVGNLYVRTSLGRLYEQQGELVDAIWEYATARADQEALRALARIGSHPGYQQQLTAAADNGDEAAAIGRRLLEDAQNRVEPYAAYRDTLRAALRLLRSGNTEAAIPELIAEAGSGNAFAQAELGRIYEKGIGTETDTELAYRYYQTAMTGLMMEESKQHDAYIEYRIGKLYRDGKGVEADAEKAHSWLLKSAEGGNRFSRYAVGNQFYSGSGVRQDSRAAFLWFERAADQKNAFACYKLGRMLRQGIGCEIDIQQAEQYDQLAFRLFSEQAVETKDDQLQYRLAVMLQKGIGTPVDLARAVAYLKLAAAQKNEDAVIALALACLKGAGVKPDIDEAVRLLTEAAKTGSRAQYVLGREYLTGEYIPQDLPMAEALLTASAGQGNPFAQYRLGMEYMSGKRLEQDIGRGLKLLHAAADQGNSHAAFAMARHYLDTDTAQEMVRADIRLRTAVGHVFYTEDGFPSLQGKGMEEAAALFAQFDCSDIPPAYRDDVKAGASAALRQMAYRENVRELLEEIRRILWQRPEAAAFLQDIPVCRTAETLTVEEYRVVDDLLPPQALQADQYALERMRQAVLDHGVQERIRRLIRTDSSLRRQLVSDTRELRETMRRDKELRYRKLPDPVAQQLRETAQKMTERHPMFREIADADMKRWERFVWSVASGLEHRRKQMDLCMKSCVISMVQMCGSLIEQVNVRKQQQAKEMAQGKNRLKHEGKRQRKRRLESDRMRREKAEEQEL